MSDVAQNGRAPEEIEELDYELDNMDNDGLGENVDDINADEEDDDLLDGKMENPVSVRKSDSDSDDDDDDMDKSEGDEDDKKDDDDDSDDDLKKQVKKGGLTAGNLNKSIAQLAAFVEAQDPATRKQALLRRAQLGKSLSKSEQSELMAFFAEKSAEAPRSRRLAKGLSQNRAIQRGVDESELFANQHVELVKALGQVEASMGQQTRAGAEFNIMLAKAVAGIGQELRRLSKSMDQVLSAPAAAPKSVGAGNRARPLAKSQGQAKGPSLSFEQANSAIQGLLHKSMEAGRYGKTATGADLLKGSMHFDSCGMIHPEIRADVERFIKENN